MPESSEHSLESLVASIWSRREAGIKLPTDSVLERPVSHDDIEYLCNYHYPYLQVMNTEADFTEEVLPKFLKLANGWVLLDYEDAMCSSYSTKYCLTLDKKIQKISSFVSANTEVGGDTLPDDDDGGDGGGTIIKQQFDVALAMIKEAQKKGWAAVEVIAGTSLMQFYAWVAAKEFGMDVYGYNPTAEEERRFKFMAKEKTAVAEEQYETEEVLSPD